jgi:hypothetical protein
MTSTVKISLQNFPEEKAQLGTPSTHARTRRGPTTTTAVVLPSWHLCPIREKTTA